MKAVKAKPRGKTEREKEVLLGMIETFLDNGKPVGSDTLKSAGFEHLSAATIRNYFSKLETEGYLEQRHTSGGRIPTEKAFRFYANEFTDHGVIESHTLDQVEKIKKFETKEVAALIRKTVEELSRISGMAAFISAPRFDQDFLIDIKVVPIDHERTLCVLVTDFGSIQTEILQTEEKLTSFAAKRIEAYLHSRLTGQKNPTPMEPEEEAIALRLYNEVIVRFLVGYNNFREEELISTGLSRMLQFPEFREPTILSDSLALFENATSLRHILRDTIAHESLRTYVGSDLLPFGAKSKETTVITIPYRINAQYVGAFGVLGPMRMPYRQLFGLVRAMSQSLGTCLTNSLYKFKLTYRQPEHFNTMVADSLVPKIEHKPMKLIEPKKGSV